MKKLCSICARGGSKGLKNKNIALLAGKPLIAHSITQAKNSGIFEHIAISSDSDEILIISKDFGADILIKRPEQLATDEAGKIPAIQHCVLETEKLVGSIFDICVDLSCTSPLRKSEDIKNCVDLLANTKCQNVITGVPSKCSPYFSLVEMNSQGFVSLSKKPDIPVLRRQDAPSCYDMNGSIYVWQREALLSCSAVILENTRLFEMKPEQGLDIDDQLDFDLVEFVGKKRGYL